MNQEHSRFRVKVWIGLNTPECRGGGSERRLCKTDTRQTIKCSAVKARDLLRNEKEVGQVEVLDLSGHSESAARISASSAIIAWSLA